MRRQGEGKAREMALLDIQDFDEVLHRPVIDCKAGRVVSGFELAQFSAHFAGIFAKLNHSACLGLVQTLLFSIRVQASMQPR